MEQAKLQKLQQQRMSRGPRNGPRPGPMPGRRRGPPIDGARPSDSSLQRQAPAANSPEREVDDEETEPSQQSQVQFEPPHFPPPQPNDGGADPEDDVEPDIFGKSEALPDVSDSEDDQGMSLGDDVDEARQQQQQQQQYPPPPFPQQPPVQRNDNPYQQTQYQYPPPPQQPPQ